MKGLKCDAKLVIYNNENVFRVGQGRPAQGGAKMPKPRGGSPRKINS